jgi:tetratricopeptide (TPR) repeat protein
MGNLYYMQDELSKAKEYYDRASALSPDNPKVLLAVARVDHELENYGTARQAYAKLKELSPELADRFAYLDLRGSQAARAADAAQLKGVVLWEEE